MNVKNDVKFNRNQKSAMLEEDIGENYYKQSVPRMMLKNSVLISGYRYLTSRDKKSIEDSC